jgi:hypothetical protein
MSGDYLPGVTQTCSPGSVCCADTNRCDFAGNCGTILPPASQLVSFSSLPSFSASNVCQSKADGITSCVNPSQITICASGNPTTPQSCANGTKCCGDSCVFPIDPLCGGNVCNGVVDTGIACTSATQFVTCLNNGILEYAFTSIGC